MAEIYDQCAVAVNGNLITDATTVSVEYVDSDQAIALLGGGSKVTMGTVVGGRMMRVSFEAAVPVLNSDMPLIQKYIDAERVTIQVFLLGGLRQLKSVGQLQAPNIRGAVAQSMSWGLSFIGEPAAFS